jgi:hypothetical protein
VPLGYLLAEIRHKIRTQSGTEIRSIGGLRGVLLLKGIQHALTGRRSSCKADCLDQQILQFDDQRLQISKITGDYRREKRGPIQSFKVIGMAESRPDQPDKRKL